MNRAAFLLQLSQSQKHWRVCDFLRDLKFLRRETRLCRIEKLTLVWIRLMVSEYHLFFLSAIILFSTSIISVS